MNPYKRLLLICDPAMHLSPAMTRAQALAGSSGAVLHMVALGSLPPSLRILDETLQDRARLDWLEKHQTWLDEQCQLLSARGIDVSAQALWSDEPMKEVLRLAEDMKADLLIKDREYEPALRRALITPLDWQVLRECAVPLHLVSVAEHALPRKVVAAVDLSQSDPQIDAVNERIIEAAQNFAVQCDADLHLLQAYEAPSSFLAYAAGPVAWTKEMQEEASGRAQTRMARLGERFGVPVHYQHLLKGPATKVIAQFAADQHMDVVVMGTLYHSGLTKVLGSTTEQALYQVPSSILAIRP